VKDNSELKQRFRVETLVPGNLELVKAILENQNLQSLRRKQALQFAANVELTGAGHLDSKQELARVTSELNGSA